MRVDNLQGVILRALRKRGGWWVKYHAGPRYSTGGVPDILGAYRGLFVAMEVKTDRGRLTPPSRHTAGNAPEGKSHRGVV